MNWEMFCLICLAVGLALPGEDRIRIRRSARQEAVRPVPIAEQARTARGREDGR
jgi:hypothetical protein